jgi:ketosteroid isomerase-like protein
MPCSPSLLPVFLTAALACGAPPRGQVSRPQATAFDSAAVADTVRKLTEAAIGAAERRDVAAEMRFYPKAGFVSAQGDLIVTTRDSLQALAEGFWESDWLKGIDIQAKIVQLHVLGPMAAAVATTSKTTIDSAGKKRTFVYVWTGVWSNTPSGWVVLQEHSSSAP